MSWGAGIVAALGLGKNLGPSKQDRKEQISIQEQRIADAYGHGYEDARREFLSLAKSFEDQLVTHLGKMKSNYICEMEVKPLGYEFVSMKPVGCMKVYRCQPISIVYNLTPQKEFVNVIENSGLGIGSLE